MAPATGSQKLGQPEPLDRTFANLAQWTRDLCRLSPAQLDQWLELARNRMLATFAAGGQRFYARAVDLYSDLVNFGTGIFYEPDYVENQEIWWTYIAAER